MNAAIMNALAEPNRLQIVEMLRDGPMQVGEIASRLEILQPQTSKHLKILNDAGLVEMRPAANRRICRLKPEPFRELDTWSETFRRIWEDRLDRLEDYLVEMQEDPEEA